MTPRARPDHPRRRHRIAVLALVAVCVVGTGDGARAVSAAPAPIAADPAGSDGAGWRLPIPDAAIRRGFEAPAHRYAPGHRGVDLAAGAGTPAGAPAPGTVVFAGPVAGRGVVTVDHGDGLVSTLEPVEPDVSPGDRVAAGTMIGRVAVGGDTPPGALHWGVRRDGEYINPLTLVESVERAVLLPCC